MTVELSPFVGPLRSLLDLLIKYRQYRNAQIDDALNAINEALIASIRYSEEQSVSQTPDREREFELSALWANAATKARHASKNLSIRLQDKSLYWSENIKWSREEVLLKRIDFEAVHHEITFLLRS